MNVEKIREDFQILKSGLIYFDNAATSLTPNQVIQEMNKFYFEYKANIGRSVHRLSQRASIEYEKAHENVARFFKANPDEIIFVKNATEALNTVASGINWRRGDKVVITLLEHHSNYITWLRAKKRFGIDVDVVKPNNQGLLDVNDFEKVIDENTRLTSFVHVSNALGSIAPVKEITELAHENDSLVMIDGAQSAPHFEIDLKEMNCDFFACSGHKMLGPTGIGALYIKDELKEEIEPLCIGGGTIEDVSYDEFELLDSYERFEAGTPNIAGGIGFSRAIDYLREVEMKRIRNHELDLTERLVGTLRELDGIEVYGPDNARDRSSVISFNIRNVNPHRVASMLDELYGILVRSGHHCCFPLMKYVIEKPKGTVRASLYFYNTREETDTFAESINNISKILR